MLHETMENVQHNCGAMKQRFLQTITEFSFYHLCMEMKPGILITYREQHKL
jgi:hypothetical protein